MKYIRILLLMGLFAVLACPASGGDSGTVTSAELKAMLDRNEPGLVIIDSRSPGQFEETHIKGAINIPLTEMEQDPSLPKAAKDARLVFYCSGTT